MMTFEEARAHIGDPVVYESRAQREGRDRHPPEAGRITSVGTSWVFVSYGRAMNSTATHPEDLTLTTDATGGDAWPPPSPARR